MTALKHNNGIQSRFTTAQAVTITGNLGVSWLRTYEDNQVDSERLITAKWSFIMVHMVF